MALDIKDISAGAAGGFFKPDESKGALAFLIEVKGFEHARPTNYGPKDSAIVDMTVFSTEADFTGEPDFRRNHRVEQTILARDLEELLGSATVVQLSQVESKKPGQKPAWVWRPVDDAIKAKVVAYANAREAALEAAVANAPSFD